MPSFRAPRTWLLCALLVGGSAMWLAAALLWPRQTLAFLLLVILFYYLRGLRK